MYPFGVSIVICCHNSKERLPATLLHLSHQKVSSDLPWEIIVVDNASTDQTSQVAYDCWKEPQPAALRVILESQLGLIHARRRGIREAQYEIISFVDDDNWVCPDWVQVVAEIMCQHPQVGALGGHGQASCEVPPPQWFEQCQAYYALGKQGTGSEDITWTRGFLYGAGMTIRKSVWQTLLDKGFSPLLQGRSGKALTSGEDVELCYAMRLAGWRLWYDSRLTFQHFIPARRLNWEYVRKLHRGCGAGALWHLVYQYALEQDQTSFQSQVKRSWQWRFLATLKELGKQPHKLLASLLSPLEGDLKVLEIEESIGKLLEILNNRQAYESAIAAIQHAPWKQSA